MYRIQTEYKGREVAFFVDSKCGVVNCVVDNQLFSVEDLSRHPTHAPHSILRELSEKEKGFLITSKKLEKFIDFCKARLKWSIGRHASNLCTPRKRTNPCIPNTGQWYLWEACNKQPFQRKTEIIQDWDWSTK